MAFGDFSQIFGGLYSMGGGLAQALTNGNALLSSTLNARDLGSAGAPDFVLLGPGSQVWTFGYSISIGFLGATPADPLGLTLRFNGAFEGVAPFTFAEAQRITLPVYGQTVLPAYTGHVRGEFPAAQWLLLNLTGSDLTVSFQFWAKAF